MNKQMFDVILAMSKDNGIGFEGKLPWHVKEELDLFKKKTEGSTLVVGRKTVLSLPLLKNRDIIVLSKSETWDDIQKDVRCGMFFCVFKSIAEVEKTHPKLRMFIAGGAEIYNEVFSNWRHRINEVHLSVMEGDHKCDTFVEFNPSEWTVKSKTVHNGFTHYVLSPVESDEILYLSLLRNVFDMGSVKIGRNGETKSMFGQALTFDLTNGFPLLTTKRMFWRGVVEELLFFIRGETDSNKLSSKKIKIWDGNTSRGFLDSIGKKRRPVGVMGPMYGYQWRNYNAPYDELTASPTENGLDQLKNVVETIRNDPDSRRILITDFNPLQAGDGVLYPCHSIILQFYVQDGYLDMFCYNRSSDLFHGLPFNIASSSLLLSLIAKITNLIPRKFILSLGDSHIYKSHYDVVQEQLKRIPYKFPTLCIKKEIKTVEDMESLSYEDLCVENYTSYTTLKAAMVS